MTAQCESSAMQNITRCVPHKFCVDTEVHARTFLQSYINRIQQWSVRKAKTKPIDYNSVFELYLTPDYCGEDISSSNVVLAYCKEREDLQAKRRRTALYDSASLRLFLENFSITAAYLATTFDEVSSEAKKMQGVQDYTSCLDKVKRLKSGWMGVDSLAPGKNVIADAEQFLALALADSLPKPLVSASESGDVSFTWSTNEKKATVTFEGDGYFGYALFDRGRYRPGECDGNLQNESLPEELVSYLRGVCEDEM